MSGHDRSSVKAETWQCDQPVLFTWANLLILSGTIAVGTFVIAMAIEAAPRSITSKPMF